MNLANRDQSAVESYPTFWLVNDVPSQPPAPVLPQKAYEAFIGCCEEDFPTQRNRGTE